MEHDKDKPSLSKPGPSSAVPLYGKIDEFDVAKESIHIYLERMELYFVANAVAEAKQPVVLLTSIIGSKHYDLLKNLLAPDLPGSKTFADLKTMLKSHFTTKPSVIAEHFYFHRQKQATGETATDFIAELRKLSLHCDYETHLDEALRDQFVSGLRSEAMHKWLLSSHSRELWRLQWGWRQQPRLLRASRTLNQDALGSCCSNKSSKPRETLTGVHAGGEGEDGKVWCRKGLLVLC